MKLLFYITLIMFPLTCFGQSGNYVVKGKIERIDAPMKAYFIYLKNGERATDSAAIHKGVFEFKGTTDAPTMAWVFIAESMENLSEPFSLYFEPGTVTVYSPDSLGTVTVKGGPVNADNERLKQLLKSSSDRADSLRKAYRTLSEEQRETLAAEVNKKVAQIYDEKKEAEITFIKNNPQSLVCLDLLRIIGGTLPDVNEVEPLFNLLSREIRGSKRGKEYEASLAKMKLIAVGATAPDFTQPDTAGNMVSLREFRGKYVLLDFWASWCGPCRAENPNVVKAYNLYKEKNFTVLAVSLDEGEKGKEAWLKAIKKDGLPWTHVSDLKKWEENISAKLYQVKGIPQNFLIDPSGKIVARDLRGKELEKKLEELLDGQ